MIKNTIIIYCPKCGYEYLPAEIYHPDELLGRPKDIIKTKDGRIECFSGTSMNRYEEYECENCGVLFEIIANISFEVKYNPNKDFTTDYQTIIYKNRVRLEEPK